MRTKTLADMEREFYEEHLRPRGLGIKPLIWQYENEIAALDHRLVEFYDYLEENFPQAVETSHFLWLMQMKFPASFHKKILEDMGR